MELIEIDRRVLTLRVAAHDESGLIGGRHTRAIIDVARFMEKCAGAADAPDRPNIVQIWHCLVCGRGL